MPIVLKLTDLASQIERVEQSTGRRIADLADSCTKALAQVAAAHEEAGNLGDRADRIEHSIAEIGSLLARMSARIEELTDEGSTSKGGAGVPYQVNAAPPWWSPGHERYAETVDRLRDWVDEVYRPGFGYLGAMLGGCWDQHPLCVVYLDTLHEAWCLLYIPPRDPKMVFAQLDWLTRPLLQAAEVLSKETQPCLRLGHREAAQNPVDTAPTWGNGVR